MPAQRRTETALQSVAELPRALEVHPSDLHRCRKELREHGARAFSGVGKKRVSVVQMCAVAGFSRAA